MSRSYGRYGVTFERYWTGSTGQAIQRRGGKDATLLGAYLQSAPAANMIGLFHLPIGDVARHTPLLELDVIPALIVLAFEHFAYYDPATEYVWVKEMARFRLGLTPERPALKKGDLRVDGVNRLYRSIDDNPFLYAFFQQYKSVLLLQKRRGAPCKDLLSPLVGAREGLVSQRSVDQEISTKQGSEIRRTDESETRRSDQDPPPLRGGLPPARVAS